MSWAFVDCEIADMFAPLTVPDVWSVAWSCEGRVEDAVSLARWSETREAKRKARAASDPDYAARRKAQTAAAYQRWKARQAKGRRVCRG